MSFDNLQMRPFLSVSHVKGGDLKSFFQLTGEAGKVVLFRETAKVAKHVNDPVIVHGSLVRES
ncbi:MAG: hypothetical protein AAGH70_03305 [Pseudomonadota bacterium]